MAAIVPVHPQSVIADETNAADVSSDHIYAGAPAVQPGSTVPPVSYENLVLLIKNSRRAFRSKVMGLPEKPSGYHPPELAGMRGIVHLTLRSRGAVLAESESSEMDIVDAAIAAGALLGQAALEKGHNFDQYGDRLGLEFEWLGPREYLKCKYFKGRGQWAEQLLHAFEPAAEGIGVEFRGRRGWTRPGEIVSLNYSPDLALKAAESAVKLKHAQKLRFIKDIKYFRFWAYHLWQPSARELPVLLLRGEALVKPEAVSPTGLDAAIQRMGSYLHYRQNSNGAFSHEYLPSADRYSDGNSARVQLRALNGLATYAAWSGNTETNSAVIKGIDNFSKYLEPLVLLLPNEQGQPVEKSAGLALMPPGHQGHLEISARLLSAMTVVSGLEKEGEHGGGRFNARSRGLIDGLIASQGQDGRLAMDFEQAQQTSDVSRPRGDAETASALLALARAYQSPSVGDRRVIAAALRRGLSYAGRKRDNLDPVGAAIMARAFALHYAQTNDARLSDLVFNINDRLVRLQLDKAVCPYPELYGAINVRRPGLIGADTAIYLSALADGLTLAARVGDQERIERYRHATSAAARFLLQLEVSKKGCYYVRSPRDVLGGVRTAPWNGRIRVDHCANAVIALTLARQALYGAS